IVATPMGLMQSPSAPATYQVTIDLTAPTVKLQAPTYTANATPTVIVSLQSRDPFGYLSTVGVDVDLNHDGKFDGPDEKNHAVGTLGSDGTVQISLDALEAGTYQLRACGSDKAGNEGVSPTVTMQVSSDPLARSALNFEVNKGQTDSQAQFLARG